MSKVFVLDTNKHPLDPVHPGLARLLLTQGRAAVLRRYPFTIILKEALAKSPRHPLRLKIDPGSKTTGLALVDDASGEVVFAAELQHRGRRSRRPLMSGGKYAEAEGSANRATASPVSRIVLGQRAGFHPHWKVELPIG